jgi:protein associated with RNAse G/E
VTTPPAGRAGLGPEISVNYRKFDGSLHWHTVLNHLGEDEHGVWLGTPPGGRWRRADGPWVAVESERLLVVPRNRWWTARFSSNPDYHTEIYSDVTMPAEWVSDTELTIVDIDLDVVKATGTGEISLLDEDEFAEHQIRYGYPEDVVEAAWASAKWLIAAMTAGDEPFGSVPERYRALLTP